jgi:hypothetical protein
MAWNIILRQVRKQEGILTAENAESAEGIRNAVLLGALCVLCGKFPRGENARDNRNSGQIFAAWIDSTS